MKANSIYSKSSVPLQRIIDRTRQKSLDELRQIITSRNISLLRRDVLVRKDSMVLTIAERELKLCPPRSTANETYTSHQRTTSSSSGSKGRPSAASNKRQHWNQSSSKASRSDTSPTKSDYYKRSKPYTMKEEKSDFLQRSIHENVCSNKLMIRTALKKLTELQVIVDEKVSGKEAQVESIIFLSCRLDQLILKFVSFLNDYDESSPVFSVDQFKGAGDMKDYLEQLIICVGEKYAINTRRATFWRYMKWLTALRHGIDISETGGYILWAGCCKCTPTTMINNVLLVYAGADLPEREVGYVPTEGEFEFEFLEFIGVCTNLAEFQRISEIYKNTRIDSKLETAKEREKKRERLKGLTNLL